MERMARAFLVNQPQCAPSPYLRPMPISERMRDSLADRYRIERELGQGGMASVVRDTDASAPAAVE